MLTDAQCEKLSSNTEDDINNLTSPNEYNINSCTLF